MSLVSSPRRKLVVSPRSAARLTGALRKRVAAALSLAALSLGAVAAQGYEPLERDDAGVASPANSAWELPAKVSPDSAEALRTDDKSPAAAGDELTKQIEAAIAQLSAEDPQSRQNAAAELAWLGADAQAAVPELLERLNDDDHFVRAHAAKAVWDIARGSEAVPVLVDLLDSTRPGIRPLSAFFLGHIGRDAKFAVPALKRALAAGSPLEGLHCAEALARIDVSDASAVKFLVDGLHDADGRVRYFAAYALSEVAPAHAERVVPALSAALSDQEESVRSAARLALAAYRAGDAGGLIIAAAQETESVVQPPSPYNGESDAGPDSEIVRCPVHKDIAAISLHIRPSREVNGQQQPLPEDEDVWERCQDELLASEALFCRDRNEMPISFNWAPTAFCHNPLWFEDANLERHGYSFGTLQPWMSAVHFYGRLPIIHYLQALDPPWECHYTLGHFRTGSRVPYMHHTAPLRLHPLAYEAGMWVALSVLVIQ